jgi:hypothetical protein
VSNVPRKFPINPRLLKQFLDRSNQHNPMRLQTGHQVQIDFKDKRLFAVANNIYAHEGKQTFHQFLVNHLIMVLSERWYYSESQKPIADRHPLLQWISGANDSLKTITPKARYGEIRSFHPSGFAAAVLTFVDDMYQLAHVFSTPDKPILKRLRDSRTFQGARYEVFTASLIARCGYEVDFVDDKTRKAPDVTGKAKDGSATLAVEAKSRHRGPLSDAAAGPLRADVGRLIREAMEQNPGTGPFLIFIDVNLPFSPQTPPAWFQEVTTFLNEQSLAKPKEHEPVSGVVATNYSWYFEGTQPSSDPEVVFFPNAAATYPLPDTFWAALSRALSEYGAIPDEEVRKIEFNKRYPDLPPLT